MNGLQAPWVGKGEHLDFIGECENCGERVYSNGGCIGQIFCSDECEHEFYHGKHIGRCDGCGEEIYENDCDYIETQDGLYCCEACRKEAVDL